MSDLISALVAAGMNAGEAVRVANAITSQIPPPAPATAAAVASTTVAAAPVAPAPQPSFFGAPIETRQSATFHGEASFTGQVAFPPTVSWGGEDRTPSAVSVLGVLGAEGGALHIQPAEIGVLNDYGLGQPQKIVLAGSAGSTSVLSSLSLTPATGSVTTPTTATFTPTTGSLTYLSSGLASVTPSYTNFLTSSTDVATTPIKISIPTTVEFDAETCTVTLGGYEDYTVLTDVILSKSTADAVSSITQTAATASTATVATGGSVSLGGGSPQTFLTGVTPNPSTVSVLSGAIGISASIQDVT